MKLNEERTKLKKLYEELRELPLPKFSSQNEISNWIEDLIEIDAHYAGLSLSVAEGENPSSDCLCDLNKFRQALDLIKLKNTDESEVNFEIINNCYSYLDKIQNIDLLLKKISRRC